MISPAVVVKVPHAHGSIVEVPLTCGDSYQDNEVFWKKNGKNKICLIFIAAHIIFVEHLHWGLIQSVIL